MPVDALHALWCGLMRCETQSGVRWGAVRRRGAARRRRRCGQRASTNPLPSPLAYLQQRKIQANGNSHSLPMPFIVEGTVFLFPQTVNGNTMSGTRNFLWGVGGTKGPWLRGSGWPQLKESSQEQFWALHRTIHWNKISKITQMSLSYIAKMSRSGYKKYIFLVKKKKKK